MLPKVIRGRLTKDSLWRFSKTITFSNSSLFVGIYNSKYYSSMLYCLDVGSTPICRYHFAYDKQTMKERDMGNSDNFGEKLKRLEN